MKPDLQETIQLARMQDGIAQTIGWLERAKRQVSINTQVARNKGPLNKSITDCIEHLRLLELQLDMATRKPQPIQTEESPVCDAQS